MKTFKQPEQLRTMCYHDGAEFPELCPEEGYGEIVHFTFITYFDETSKQTSFIVKIGEKEFSVRDIQRIVSSAEKYHKKLIGDL